jgi:hypothetical protein
VPDTGRGIGKRYSNLDCELVDSISTPPKSESIMYPIGLSIFGNKLDVIITWREVLFAGMTAVRHIMRISLTIKGTLIVAFAIPFVKASGIALIVFVLIYNRKYLFYC